MLSQTVKINVAVEVLVIICTQRIFTMRNLATGLGSTMSCVQPSFVVRRES